MQDWRRSNRGFTLTELLVAAAVGGIVVAMSGWAMVVILQNNRRIEEQAITRMNLSRALDFISDDIRSAIRISTTAPSDWDNSQWWLPVGDVYRKTSG